MKIRRSMYKRAIELLREMAESGTDTIPYTAIGRFFQDLDAEQPRRSTTHDERVFYLTDATRLYPHHAGATVYMRKELWKGEEVWMGSISFCQKPDQFVKARGRTLAKRRFFAGVCDEIIAKPDQEGLDLYDGAWQLYRERANPEDYRQ